MILSKISAIDSPFFNKSNTGLGNILFQIFTSFGIAKKYGLHFNNTYLNILLIKLEKFNLDHKKTIYRNLITNSLNLNTFKLLNETSGMYALYDNNLIKVIKSNNRNNYCINGYFQSHLYFDEYRDIILKLLQPDDKSLAFINNKYSNLLDVNTINISVHIRNNWGKNIKYNLNFFYKAIDYILNNITYKNIIINVFSDDILTIEKIFKYNNHNIIFYKDNPDYIDLWCMSLCHHNIISHSTLSWWGAYLNENPNKIVIYPKDILRLFQAKIYLNYQQMKRIEQHYKKEWIALNEENVIYEKIKN